jgi:hypothetical protein
MVRVFRKDAEEGVADGISEADPVRWMERKPVIRYLDIQDI